ncbi:hypothetical protein [Rhodococcus sp. NPDC058481]|uniref:hypothetical protein n=1 Tax=unclassified Rhodococcus (in: high G+C Gram-positive bacteria) TaxID=192944 RepID=UPI00365D101D
MTTMLLAAQDLPETVADDLKKILGYAAGVIGLICLGRLIFVGARMAWDHKHGAGLESPVGAEAIAAIVGWILASGACVGIATALINEGQAPQSDTQTTGSCEERAAAGQIRMGEMDCLEYQIRKEEKIYPSGEQTEEKEEDN